MLERVRAWAATRHAILLRGERGTGKTVLAEWIHCASGRTGRFVSLSLAQLSDGLEGDDLRGHVRGAFTGAEGSHKGAFEQAHGGTLLLDELGRSSLRTQGVLLRQLEVGRVLPQGGERDIPVDVRVIAATNSDLEAMVAAGSFLADLVDRFGYYEIRMPPLRERRGDILPMLKLFLERECADAGRPAPRISAEVARVFLKAPWPDNVRGLVKMAEYLAISDSAEIGIADLPAVFLERIGLRSDSRHESLHDRALRALAKSGGNKTETARRLSISRGHLYRVLRAAGPSGD